MARQLWRYIMYVSMTLLPLLVGWGLDDPGGLFREPARAAYAGLAIFGSLSVFVPRLNVQPFAKGSQVVGCNLTRAYLASGIGLLFFFLLPIAGAGWSLPTRPSCVGRAWCWRCWGLRSA